jgi:hypothetical protein
MIGFWCIFNSFKNVNLNRKTGKESTFPKPGGLDVETNRDRDRERPSCRDWLFFGVEIEISIETLTKIETLGRRDQSRLRSRTSFVSRLTFENRRDFLDGRDWLFFGVEIEISIETMSRPIETPRLNFSFKNKCHSKKFEYGKFSHKKNIFV